MTLFKKPPSIGQFAKDGNWENALSFEMDNPISFDELKAYLATSTEIAFELFFDDSFFGIRFEGESNRVLELSEHCLACLHNISDFNTFIAALEAHPAIGKLCQEVSHVEIGAVNAWKSIGSFVMPLPAQALANIDEVWSNSALTHLKNEDKHPKAVEIAYAAPYPHWLGFPISTKEHPYALSKVMLTEVLRKFVS